MNEKEYWEAIETCRDSQFSDPEEDMNNFDKEGDD